MFKNTKNRFVFLLHIALILIRGFIDLKKKVKLCELNNT